LRVWRFETNFKGGGQECPPHITVPWVSATALFLM
jgi:hypothetical protein